MEADALDTYIRGLWSDDEVTAIAIEQLEIQCVPMNERAAILNKFFGMHIEVEGMFETFSDMHDSYARIFAEVGDE